MAKAHLILTQEYSRQNLNNIDIYYNIQKSSINMEDFLLFEKLVPYLYLQLFI
jgi:hypothetical protein